MQLTKLNAFTFLAIFFAPHLAMAQAFGEYGRAAGGVAQRQGSAAPKASEGAVRGGKGVIQGVGGLDGRPLPSRLVVAAKVAVLYPRQDEESEKVGELGQGEILIPMVQSAGGNDWYMVKTAKGLVGWVKSSDTREEPIKKP